MGIKFFMHKWILAAVIGMSIAVSFIVIKYGLRPKPVPIIKASNFEEPRMLATYLYRQLFQKFKTVDVVIFGFNEENAYEKSVVEEVIAIVTNERGEDLPEFLLFTPDESFSNSGMSRQKEARKRFNDNALSFTMINLDGVAEAPGILDCEKDHTYSTWLSCIKAQKVRQINRARKADPKKPTAIVENQSLHDIMIYIRD